MDSSIINLLATYELPSIFFGSFFFGETVVIAAAFLAGQGIWSIHSVFWLLLAGTIVSDFFWFLFGDIFFGSTGRWGKYQAKYHEFLAKLEKLTGERPYFALLFVKFIYGVRILTIVYLSLRKISSVTFLIFNIIGTSLWLLVLISIGWFAGRGVANAAEVFQRVEYMLAALVLFVIFFRMVTIWFGKKTVK